MGYTAPPTFVDTNVLYAADLNQYLRDNMAWLEAVRPHVEVGKAASQSVATGSWVNPSLDTEQVDAQNMHASSNSFVTVPADGGGFWVAGGSAQWDTDGNGARRVQLRTGSGGAGGVHLAGTTSAAVGAGAGAMQEVSTGAYLAAGATIYLGVWQNSGSSRTITDARLWAVRICA